jgi:hypothetical protein
VRATGGAQAGLYQALPGRHAEAVPGVASCPLMHDLPGATRAVPGRDRAGPGGTGRGGRGQDSSSVAPSKMPRASM